MSTIRTSNQQASDSELSSQLNFVTKNIEQLVKQSSNFDIAANVSTSTLKLRMQNPAQDPTCVYLSGGVVKLAQGNAGQADKNNCTTVTTDLTTSNVVVNSLAFRKITFYPGHDEVTLDLQMTYNSSNPQQQVSRLLHSAFSRVSAATFDDNLLPGSSASYDLGTSGSPWRNGYFSGSVRVSNGSVYISTPSSGYGLILPDSNGSGCHLITVNASGTLATAVSACQ